MESLFYIYIYGESVLYIYLYIELNRLGPLPLMAEHRSIFPGTLLIEQLGVCLTFLGYPIET